MTSISEDIPAGVFYTHESARITDELQRLAADIREQNLAEAHSRTIRQGWAQVAALGDAMDLENGIKRPMDHASSIDLAWASLLKDDDTDRNRRSGSELYERMVFAGHQRFRTYILDILDLVTSDDKEIEPSNAESVKKAVSYLLKSYGLTDILRNDVATKIGVATHTVSMSPEVDLIEIYKKKLGVRVDTSVRTKGSHPVVLREAGYFEGSASREISSLIKKLGLPVEVSDVRALLKAGSLMSLYGIKGKERTVINSLRRDYFRALIKGQITHALQLLEDMILVDPGIGTPATYDLLGLDEEARRDIARYHEEEIQVDAKVKEKRTERWEIFRQEKELFGPWLEKKLPELQNKVCEVLDEDGQPTGQIIRLLNPRVDRYDYGERPALSKSHYDIYRSESGKMVFASHVAGYFRASVLFKLIEDGRLAFYDSLAAYVADRYPDVSGFEELTVKLNGTEEDYQDKIRKFGKPVMVGWMLERFSSK